MGDNGNDLVTGGQTVSCGDCRRESLRLDMSKFCKSSYGKL